MSYKESNNNDNATWYLFTAFAFFLGYVIGKF